MVVESSWVFIGKLIELLDLRGRITKQTGTVQHQTPEEPPNPHPNPQWLSCTKEISVALDKGVDQMLLI